MKSHLQSWECQRSPEVGESRGDFSRVVHSEGPRPEDNCVLDICPAESHSILSRHMESRATSKFFLQQISLPVAVIQPVEFLVLPP